MEWLINRRRMMFYKAVPPVYLSFEDRRIWEICCYNWGDAELVTGIIDSDSARNGKCDSTQSSNSELDYWRYS